MDRARERNISRATARCEKMRFGRSLVQLRLSLTLLEVVFFVIALCISDREMRATLSACKSAPIRAERGHGVVGKTSVLRCRTCGIETCMGCSSVLFLFGRHLTLRKFG